MSNSNPPDRFVEMSTTTWKGLNDAVRELGWIADGGDPSASQADQDLANLKRAEFERERVRVMQRLMAYLAKQLSVSPPSQGKLDQAKSIAVELAQFRDVNVKATAIVHAATNLLNIYAQA